MLLDLKKHVLINCPVSGHLDCFFYNMVMNIFGNKTGFSFLNVTFFRTVSSEWTYKDKRGECFLEFQ